MQTVMTFILVHGALLGSGGFDKTVSQIQALGHNAIILDLPGRAGDTTDPKKIDLKLAAEKVANVMKLQSGKVILVGHSQGGLVISQAAEMYPEKVQSLIYVAALLPKNGQTLGEIIKDDAESLIGPNLVVDADNGTMHFNPKGDFRNVFAQDISEEEGKKAYVNSVSEPLGIGGTPVELSSERFGRIPRAYILATRDRVLTPKLQEKMIREVGVDRITRLDSSHSPFLSMPKELAKALVELSR
jgi:pimeloyl-ACP methyl ester carboxylesterase